MEAYRAQDQARLKKIRSVNKKIQKVSLSARKQPENISPVIFQRTKSGKVIPRARPPKEFNDDGPRAKRRCKKWKFVLKEKLKLNELKELFIYNFDEIKDGKAKGPLYERTVGVLFREETKEVLLYLRKPVAQKWIESYPFIDQESVKIWVDPRRYFKELIDAYPAFVPTDFTFEWEETVKFRDRLIHNLNHPHSPPREMQIESEKNLDEDREAELIEQFERIKYRLNEYYVRVASGEKFEDILDECKKAGDGPGTLILAENEASLKTVEKQVLTGDIVFEERYVLYFSNAYDFEDYKESVYEGNWKDRWDAIKKNKQQLRTLLVLGWNPVAIVDMVENGFVIDKIEEILETAILEERKRFHAKQVLSLLKDHLKFSERLYRSQQ